MLKPEILKFETTITKDKSASDSAQVPAQGATLTVYKQGATVQTPVTIPASSSDVITVYNRGSIEVGDFLFLNAAPGTNSFEVTAVTDTTITATNVTAGSIALVADDRLVSNDTVTIYSESSGTTSTTNPTTADANGYIKFYCPFEFFDYLVAGTGLTSRLFRDVAGGWTNDIVNAKVYTSLQAAVNDTPEGGTLYIPAGSYSVPSGGLLLQRTITVQGGGPGSLNGVGGTTLNAFSAAANQPIIKIVPHYGSEPYVGNIKISALKLNGGTTTSYTGSHGIQLITPTGTTYLHLNLDHLRIGTCGDDGIHVEGDDGAASAVMYLCIRDCEANYNRGDGLYIRNTTASAVYTSAFTYNQGRGVYVEGSGVAFHACTCENNCLSATLDATYDAQMRLYLVRPGAVTSCHFETYNTASQLSAKRGLVIQQCEGMVVQGCFFANGTDLPDPVRGIFVSESVEGYCTIMPNYFWNTNVAVEVAPAAKFVSVWPQQIAAGTTFMAHAGIALPAVPTSNIITPPAASEGQLVYDITLHTLKVWNGTAWKTVTVT